MLLITSDGGSLLAWLLSAPSREVFSNANTLSAARFLSSSHLINSFCPVVVLIIFSSNSRFFNWLIFLLCSGNLKVKVSTLPFRVGTANRRAPYKKAASDLIFKITAGQLCSINSLVSGRSLAEGSLELPRAIGPSEVSSLASDTTAVGGGFSKLVVWLAVFRPAASKILISKMSWGLELLATTIKRRINFNAHRLPGFFNTSRRSSWAIAEAIEPGLEPPS